MSEKTMTRRAAIGLTCGAGLAATAMAVMAGLKGLTESEMRQSFEPMVRPDSLEPAADVKSYVLEHAMGIGTTMAAAGTKPTTAADTCMPVRVHYTIVDAALVPEGTDFNTMWADPSMGPYAHYAQYTVIRTLLDIGDPDHYVMLIAPWAFNDATLSINYVAYTHDNDNGELVHGCHTDFETGITYVPKSYYTDDDGSFAYQPLRMQVMLRVDLAANKIENTVPVTILCDDDRLDLPTRIEVTSSGHSLETVIPLCGPEQAEMLASDEISWWVSGMDASQSMFGNSYAVDEDGNLRIQAMGFTMPGIEVYVRRADAPTAPLGTRMALAMGNWNDMRIWKWGYLRYDDQLQRLCDNNTVFYFTGDPNAPIAVDSRSWDEHPVIRDYIKEYFDDLAPYTYNIFFMNGTTDFPDRNVSIERSSKAEILADMYQFLMEPEFLDQNGNVKTFNQLQAAGHAQDFLDVWQHWLMLPSSDVIKQSHGDGLGIQYWQTIKNAAFDNAYIGTPQENAPRYRSCVLSDAICIHTEMPADGYGQVDEHGIYVGPLYARVLNVDRYGRYPSVVIGFYTDGFGFSNKGQSAHTILRFPLKPDTGFVTLQKGLTL